MFTILNFLNYAIGKKINTIVLILLSIAIYVGLIKYYYDTIHENTIYTVTLLILMLIDIISIIIIFFYFKDSSDSNNVIQEENNIVLIVNKDLSSEKNSKDSKNKKDKKDSKGKKDKKDGKEKKSTREKNIDQKQLENNVPTQTFIKGNEEKELISLYDVNKDVSLGTYK